MVANIENTDSIAPQHDKTKKISDNITEGKNSVRLPPKDQPTVFRRLYVPDEWWGVYSDESETAKKELREEPTDEQLAELALEELMKFFELQLLENLRLDAGMTIQEGLVKETKSGNIDVFGAFKNWSRDASRERPLTVEDAVGFLRGLYGERSVGLCKKSDLMPMEPTFSDPKVAEAYHRNLSRFHSAKLEKTSDEFADSRKWSMLREALASFYANKEDPSVKKALREVARAVRSQYDELRRNGLTSGSLEETVEQYILDYVKEVVDGYAGFDNTRDKNNQNWQPELVKTEFTKDENAHDVVGNGGLEKITDFGFTVPDFLLKDGNINFSVIDVKTYTLEELEQYSQMLKEQRAKLPMKTVVEVKNAQGVETRLGMNLKGLENFARWISRDATVEPVVAIVLPSEADPAVISDLYESLYKYGGNDNVIFIKQPMGSSDIHMAAYDSVTENINLLANKLPNEIPSKKGLSLLAAALARIRAEWELDTNLVKFDEKEEAERLAQQMMRTAGFN